MMTYHSAKTQGYLEAAKVALEAQNPGKTFVLDSGAVWLRENGKDWGIYSAALHTEKVIYCVDARGMTPLHRPTPCCPGCGTADLMEHDRVACVGAAANKISSMFDGFQPRSEA